MQTKRGLLLAESSQMQSFWEMIVLLILILLVMTIEKKMALDTWMLYAI